MNPEETPLFRKELTGETHKAEGERVRGQRGEERKAEKRRKGRRKSRDPSRLRAKRQQRKLVGEGEVEE